VPSIPIDRRSLPNGLRVVLSPDTRAPVAAVNLWYAVGSKNEKAGKTGFAHLFEHMMFQGSEHVEKGQHFSLVQGAGGTLNATTSLDRTNYFETLPSHQLELALWLEADRMANLVHAISQEKLDNQREVVKNERRWSVDNQPYGTWDEKLQELTYPESHPYHHSVIGSMEDLEAASLHDVTEFFETFYRPNNAVLSIVGDFEPDKAMAMIERHFGPIPANPQLPPQPNVDLDPLLIGHEVREVVPDKVPLPRVYLAYRIPSFGSETFDALEVGADLLGRGRASRLYASLVRRDRLAQDVEVYPLTLLGSASVFAIWATARPEVPVDRLEAAIHREVGRLVKDGAHDDEVDRVRNLHDSAVASSLEAVSERADRLSMYTTLFDAPERINAEMSRYEAVSPAQARDALANYIREDNQVALTYVPAQSAEEAA